MAVRRTLKQKQQAQVHRLETMTYVLPKDRRSTTGVAIKQNREVNDPAVTRDTRDAKEVMSHTNQVSALHGIFGYAPQLLLNDVVKSLVTTIVVMGVLLALVWGPWLR